MTRRLCAEEGLSVRSYDAAHAALIPQTPVEGDVAFYVDLARRLGGPIAEFGCGTGRVTWPLAEAGFEVVAVDLSAAMRKAAAVKAPDAQAAERVTFCSGDVAQPDLGRLFPLILVTFRTWQVLLTTVAQRASLTALREHLAPDGRLVIDLFDPRLDLLAPTRDSVNESCGTYALPSGTTVEIWNKRMSTNPLRQVIEERFIFIERDADGTEIRRETDRLALRWTYRQEMRHLVELCGLVVEAEYGDFKGAPPTYGREQVWVLRAASA